MGAESQRVMRLPRIKIEGEPLPPGYRIVTAPGDAVAIDPQRLSDVIEAVETKRITTRQALFMLLLPR
jgi:hypothetical protein